MDVLRGFALLGILVVNLRLFKSPLAVTPAVTAFDGALDRAVRWLIAFAFESKFYVLFSFLFGYGLSVQVTRAAAQGAPIAARYLRRLGGLLVIGAAHALLLFTGDILMAYAVLGVLLLPARNAAPWSLLGWAAALIGGWALLLGLLALSTAGAGAPPPAPAGIGPELAASIAETEAAYRGDPASVIAQRARELPAIWEAAILTMAPSIVAMFLTGLWAGRRGLLARVAEHQPLLRRVQRVGLAVGLPGAAFYATAIHQVDSAPALAIAGYAASTLTAPALSGAYAATIALANQRPGAARLLAPLAPLGRMALTNYLLQSTICAFVFTGYGLGLFNRVSPSAGLAFCLAVFACQIPLSAWWLRRFRFGPAEWLLRSLTYRRLQPFRAA